MTYKIIDVEQGTKEWLNHRKGMITGTMMSNLETPAKRKTLLNKLISEEMMIYDMEQTNMSASMEHGVIHEPFARREYEKRKGVEVQEVGMVIWDKNSKIGFSPDGVIMEGGVIVGGIEIKCPNSHTHIEYMLNGGVPKKYMHQVMMPFLICDTVQFWDFISYDERLSVPMFVHRVNRDDLDLELGNKLLDESTKMLENVSQIVSDLEF